MQSRLYICCVQEVLVVADVDSTRDGDARTRLDPYLTLVAALVDRRIDPETFQRLYTERYLADDTIWSDAEFLVLDKLHAEADDFEADPSLREQMTHSLDENELRRRAAGALRQLRKLTEGMEN
jgi:Bacterial self-protective colicin-like immunity